MIKQLFFIELIDIDMVSDRDAASSEHDPSVVFDRKVERLAELLDCSEEEATRIILDRL